MQRLIIGAPFGNYLEWEGATSTVGTHTLRKRAGFLKRWWRVLSTVRYWGKVGGWVNKLGLPSPGSSVIKDIDGLDTKILSIKGFHKEEWLELTGLGIYHRPRAIEFNLSCPNIGESLIVLDEVEPAIRKAVRTQDLWWGPKVIVKLPPVRWMSLAIPLYYLGVRCFHCCNTIPVPGGGLSGKALKNYALWATSEIKDKWPEVTVIGGGGVTGTSDIYDYVKAGADHVAVASMLLNPFNWRKVPTMISCIDSLFTGKTSA